MSAPEYAPLAGQEDEAAAMHEELHSTHQEISQLRRSLSEDAIEAPAAAAPAPRLGAINRGSLSGRLTAAAEPAAPAPCLGVGGKKASAAATTGLLAPLPPGLSAPGTAALPAGLGKGSVSFAGKPADPDSAANNPPKPSSGFKVDALVVNAAQKSLHRTRSTTSSLREKEAEAIMKINDEKAAENGDVPAPVWFEREFFSAWTEDYWKVRGIYTLLGLAPVLTSAGSFMELFFDCPTHTPMVELFFAVGMLFFSTVWLSLYWSLQNVVKGASHNSELMERERARADQEIKKFLEDAEDAAAKIQGTYRARLASTVAAGGKTRAPSDATLRQTSTAPGGRTSTSHAAVDRVATDDDAPESSRKSRSATRKITRTTSQDMESPKLRLHFYGEIQKQMDLEDQKKQKQKKQKEVGGLKASTSMPPLRNRLKVAGILVQGIERMSRDQIESSIEKADYEAQVEEVEKLLVRMYDERSNTIYDLASDDEGPDEDLDNADQDEEQEEATDESQSPPTNCCGCYIKDPKKKKTKEDEQEREKRKERERQAALGPFVNLAFDRGLKRVKITPTNYNHLIWSRAACVIIWLMFFVTAIGSFIGVVDLMRADFELNSGQIGFVGRKVDDMFFPAKGCVSDTTNHIYAVLILILWVPSCLVASLVWPIWLLSLFLGTVLANDDVEDLMKELQPATVKAQALLDISQEKKEEHWQKKAALPGAMLVATMDQLTAWGTGMGHALVGCVGFSLGLVPTAVASHSLSMSVIAATVLVWPMVILYMPATVSSACDDLLDQLNDISFLGDPLHKDRCTHL